MEDKLDRGSAMLRPQATLFSLPFLIHLGRPDGGHRSNGAVVGINWAKIVQHQTWDKTKNGEVDIWQPTLSDISEEQIMVIGQFFGGVMINQFLDCEHFS